jgi:phosphatidylserine/phosphatidylglycerophosphate/cardiolipin synthase-like enzyme
VTVTLARGTYHLDDGEASVELHGPGTVVVAREPANVTSRHRVVGSELRLANAGERVWLRRDNRTLHAVDYPRAEPGSRYHTATSAWRPVGLRPREPVALGPAETTAFVLPDAPGPPVETLRAAEERVLLAGYTFGSERVVTALRAAVERGVAVRVLLDGSPVGGVEESQAATTAALVDAGVAVRHVDGEAAQFRFHHPKYAVVDDRALVLTENWKPSGTGGASNRGWGVRLDSDTAARELAAVFRHDWRGRGTQPASTSGDDAADTTRGDDRTTTDWREPESAGETGSSFPARFEPTATRANATFLLTSPGNAGAGVVRVIDAADRRVAVLQPTVERGRLLAAARRAAARGVQVRLLLSSAWYVEEDNRALAEDLSAWADRANATLSVRLVDPGGAFQKLHAKGIVADDTAVVGSLNWNPTSVGENREVAVAIRDPVVADYYRRVFDADWTGPDEGFGGGRVPQLLLVAAVGAVAGVAVLIRRRLRFADATER